MEPPPSQGCAFTPTSHCGACRYTWGRLQAGIASIRYRLHMLANIFNFLRFFGEILMSSWLFSCDWVFFFFFVLHWTIHLWSSGCGGGDIVFLRGGYKIQDETRRKTSRGCHCTVGRSAFINASNHNQEDNSEDGGNNGDDDDALSSLPWKSTIARRQLELIMCRNSAFWMTCGS